ncbi:MAG TPA: ATP F0F1 synthase subunit B [Devosia sp.]|nr:ATP F0F1 synthase subunit B [Devosia sp.]
MEFDNTFWAAVGYFIFFGILIYIKVPKLLAKALDGRIAKIQTDLDEAKQLREDAQALLAEYERKRKAAESEAEEIVTAAKEESERMAEEAKVALEELIVRRTKAVEDKIAQAEAQAVAEVRSRSAEVAVEAARVLLVEQMADKGDALVEEAIKDVGNRIN